MKLNNKPLLLKTLQAVFTEHVEIKLVLTWRHPSCWLSYTALEVAIQAVLLERKMPSIVLLSCEPSEL